MDLLNRGKKKNKLQIIRKNIGTLTSYLKCNATFKKKHIQVEVTSDTLHVSTITGKAASGLVAYNDKEAHELYEIFKELFEDENTI